MVMLIPINRLLGAPVMSLQTGYPLCRLSSPIINPYNLKVVAFYVDGPTLSFKPAVLFSEDIREFSPRVGAIVDSADNIMSPNDLVRLADIINYNFNLDNLLVIDQQGHKLGHIRGFSIDSISYEVEQLYVKPGFFKSFSTAEFLINRQQIVKVEPDRITVKTPTVEAKAKDSLSASQRRQILNPDLDNPFRSHKPVTNQDVNAGK